MMIFCGETVIRCSIFLLFAVVSALFAVFFSIICCGCVLSII